VSNRQQRRLFDRQLRKLIKTKGDNCSLCGGGFQHNSRTFGGYDEGGEIALVGECCVGRLFEVHTAGLFSHRNYDFLPAGQNSMTRGLGPERVVNALGALERAISFADEEAKDELWQRGGMAPPPHGLISVLDHPWKKDDRDWFERHPGRSHRARFPFDGEVGEELVAPEGHRLLVLLRQVELPASASRSGSSSPTSCCCRCPMSKPSRMRCSTSPPGASRYRAAARQWAC
jgi:hypothetical protein